MILPAAIVVVAVSVGLGPIAFGVLRGWEDVSLASLVRSGRRLRFDWDRALVVPAESEPSSLRPSPRQTESATPCRYRGASGDGRCASCGAPR